MKRLNILIIILSVLVSCEAPYDLDHLSDKDLIVLDCIMVSGDTTVIDVRSAIPVGDYGEKDHDADISVTVTVDGEEIPIRTAEKRFLMTDLKPGQKAVIRAEAEGMDPVFSEAVVPHSAFGSCFEAVGRDGIMYDIVELKTSGSDNHEGGCYGVEIAGEITSEYSSNGQLDSVVTRPAPVNMLPAVDLPSDDSLYGDPDKMQIPVIMLGGHRIYLIRDFKDGRRFRVSNERVAEYEYFNPETEVRYKLRVSWKISMRFWTISEEVYRYTVKGGNSFSEMGLTSPSYVYTNIIGGAGIFGVALPDPAGWQTLD